MTTLSDPPDSLALFRRNNPPEVPVDGCYNIQAEGEWLLSGPSDHLELVLKAFGPLAHRAMPGLIELNFGNSVGMLDVPHVGRLEVFSRKWGSEDFDRMLQDLTAIASSLPFASGIAAALPYDRTIVARREILYHIFVYLRYVLSCGHRSSTGDCAVALWRW